MKGFQTSKALNMMYMFYSCKNLTELFLDTFKTNNCKNFSNIFGNCNNNLKVYINPIYNSKFVEEIEDYVNIINI